MKTASNSTIHSRYKRQARSYELQLAESKRAVDNTPRLGAAEIAAFVEEKAGLMEANRRLTAINGDIRDEVEELRSMVELLNGEISGKKGLISDSRSRNPP